LFLVYPSPVKVVIRVTPSPVKVVLRENPPPAYLDQIGPPIYTQESTPKIPPITWEKHTTAPPPQCPYVELRPNLKKTLN
jgi:hypothetical protein